MEKTRFQPVYVELTEQTNSASCPVLLVQLAGNKNENLFSVSYTLKISRGLPRVKVVSAIFTLSTYKQRPLPN